MSKLHEREEIKLDKEMICAYLDEMSGQKRERLSALLDSQDFTLPGYTDKVVFAKSEALLKHPGAQPRVVYQGGDMYNLVMGSVVYHLSRRIVEELNRSNPKNKGREIIYCVGLTADEIADIVHHTPGHALENDFKNNDGSQPAGVRKWESMFYYKLGAPRWFVREFAANTRVRIFTRYGVKGQVRGQRWSGEVTTTTGNGYVNACISLASLRHAQIEKATVLVYGDDNLTYTMDDRTKLSECFHTVSDSVGMKSEVKVVPVREQATFLRKRFVPGAFGTLPVPSFGRVLSKLPVRANFNASVTDDDYMAGKLLSAAYEHRHIASLRTLLLETAEQMSSKPHMDMRNQAMAYKYTAEELKEMTVNAKTIDPVYLDSFLAKVYQIGESELVDCYVSVCDGILGYKRVNHGRGNRAKHDPTTLAPKIPRALWDTAFESLVCIDVAL
ncbi:RNA-dependent RNA polymerase [Penicillium vanoranjei associated RNA virus 1]|nr:RNA-dependent RNA polymerase [Penicillium vanoranjei associated RNA virus 1]